MLKSLKEGDARAFGKLYEKYYHSLYYKAFSIVRDKYIAEDLVQECFTDFYQKKLYNHVHTSLQALLFIRIKHQCLNYLEKENRESSKKRKYSHVVLATESMDYVEQYMENKAKSEEFEKIRHHLSGVLDKLPQQQHSVLLSLYRDGATYKDSAHSMGISLNTFQTYVQRAIKKLRLHFNTEQ
ncbi:DNA-directed RNA polymerase sigma-70 factor [Chitinophaga cymbidii]|uniref:DNA-directed RNA polymerase sigma-70 factor n=1 Tax=Chitinophaga cymbidii TaxID=1096750 RepID=A0A512RFN7_9BACT|nr:DNA-directed RNA polymerase sigma-70 factor [Chitinophaga cymbidii]